MGAERITAEGWDWRKNEIYKRSLMKRFLWCRRETHIVEVRRHSPGGNRAASLRTCFTDRYSANRFRRFKPA